MSGPDTVDMPDYWHPERSTSRSAGRDMIDRNNGTITKFVIDTGKAFNSTLLCAVISGICMAVTIGTVWHAKERETETQARIRVLQNHIDENTAILRVLEKGNVSTK